MAIGLKITLSKPWFNEKVALFKGSKQSLVGLDFLVNLISPSDPANAFVASKILTKISFNNFHFKEF